MKMTLQVVIEDEDHRVSPIVKEVFSLERNSEELRPETLGLSLDEAKDVLAEIQTTLVTTQATCFLQNEVMRLSQFTRPSLLDQRLGFLGR